MYGTILAFIKFNNFGTWRLNGPRHLFHSFCCTTRSVFEPLRVYEPGFNTDKYGKSQHETILADLNQYTAVTRLVIILTDDAIKHTCIW